MDVGEVLDATSPAVRWWSTGLSDLDEATGGLRPGSLWLIVGTPGQGRSTMLTQLAVQLAMVERASTQLCSARDDVVDIRARLVSLATGASLPVPRESCRVDVDPEGLLRVRAAPLVIEPGPGLAGPLPRDRDVLLVDDAHVGGCGLREELEAIASGGTAVVATAPLRVAVRGPGWGAPLRPGWGEAADVILEVDSVGPRQRFGEVQLRLHRNRRGPLTELTLANHDHLARFRSTERRGSRDERSR